jgi:phosphoribosylformylglycinamidine synthase
MKLGVVVFPGSNCDHDALRAAAEASGQAAVPLWHESQDLEGCDGILLPGGFSYGDYLRAGALAHFSPIMPAIAKFADAGHPVLGICNGFQILCEAGLLPGALLRNAGLRFVCRQVPIRVESTSTPFTSACERGEILYFPVAHGEGSYFAPPEVLDRLEQRQQVVFRYAGLDRAGAHGVPGPGEPQAGRVAQPLGAPRPSSHNPNGSLRDIAGICNEGRNVAGLMPHPERARRALLGSGDGEKIFASLAAVCQ